MKLEIIDFVFRTKTRAIILGGIFGFLWYYVFISLYVGTSSKVLYILALIPALLGIAVHDAIFLFLQMFGIRNDMVCSIAPFITKVMCTLGSEFLWSHVSSIVCFATLFYYLRGIILRRINQHASL